MKHNHNGSTEKGTRNHKFKDSDFTISSTINKLLKKRRNKKRRQYNTEDIPSI